MTTELHEGPLETATEVAAPVRRTWREQRERRRRRRIWMEEILGWILVPAIVVGCYWAAEGVMTALGTSPSAILNGFNMVTSGF
ncbi:hypothetical protein [Microvirga flavescens]|uniref:hypothetical protein n=1 Tax=Microvirga flavescens TaxID=2249811 RepID=UPI000DD52285|nr:hypothetical protein [Microvirga flavescens]